LATAFKSSGTPKGKEENGTDPLELLSDAGPLPHGVPAEEGGPLDGLAPRHRQEDEDPVAVLPIRII